MYKKQEVAEEYSVQISLYGLTTPVHMRVIKKPYAYREIPMS
jgi:hypothetical protein